MSTCAQCGAENVEGAGFCANCGNSLVRPSAAPGAPIQPPPATPYAQPPPGQQPAAPPPGAPYQQQPRPYQPAAPTTNGKATASLVLGIVGIFICPLICSILAIVLGYSARNEIAASGGYQGGDSYATAGIILGWVGIILALIWVTLWIIFGVIAVSTSTLILPMMI